MSDDKATDAEGLRLVEELLDDDDPSGLSREGRRLAARVGEPYVEGGCVHFPGGRVMTLDWTGAPVALRVRGRPMRVWHSSRSHGTGRRLRRRQSVEHAEAER